MGEISTWLDLIDQANREGARVSTETLTYLAGGTSISADVFRNRDWRKIFNIDYSDVQWVATGEWLTEESWHHYAKEQPHGAVNHHYVKSEWLDAALAWPQMMVSTDALPAIDLDVLSNPNVAGTFAKFIGEHVRERKRLPLREALAKTSLYQANWLSLASPAFLRKGRLQVGADADIVVFDLDEISANADYGKPYRPSSGIDYVIVAGRLVVAQGQRLTGRYPGIRLLGKHYKQGD